jgi:hypothetical protein|tara:strand:+ start:214 stop:510 length:297 start_codon:yes stop_codon:yes gene_type:complete
MKKYVIIDDPSAEIVWSAVDQNSRDECEEDLTGSRFVISYSSEEPPAFLDDIEDKSMAYSKEDLIPLLVDPDWSVYATLTEDDLSEESEKTQYYTDNL